MIGGVAIYTPDNPALVAVLASLPGRLWRYADHARLLLHFTASKARVGDVDRWGFSRLSANILRGYIPARVLVPLKDHLKAAGVLETAGWSVGRAATGFKILPAFSGPSVRHVLTNTRLAEKVAEFRASFATADTSDGAELREVINRRRPVLDHLRRCLGRLSLPDAPRAVADAAIAEGAGTDWSRYATQVIGHGDDVSIKVDGFGWRVHSILTRIPREVRHRLLLDGRPLAEVDVSCAQPLLLACFLVEHRTGPELRGHEGTRGERERTPSMLCAAACPTYVVRPRVVHMLCASVPAGELRDFTAACEAGLVYDLLAADVRCSRDTAKGRMWSQVLFGDVDAGGKTADAFARRWPNVLRVIREWKRLGDYRDVSRTLQRWESTIMIDHVLPSLLAGDKKMGVLTVHDALAVMVEDADRAQHAIEAAFGCWGLKPRVKVK